MLKDVPDWLKKAPPGWAQQHGYTLPEPEAPKKQQFGNTQYGRPAMERMDGLTDAEWSAYSQHRHFQDTMDWAAANGLSRIGGGGRKAAPAAPPSESPYDIVGGYSANGVNYMGRPRWEAERDRQKAEMELENQRLQMEYQRWMIEQMKNNPSGMNIRDLLSRMK